MKAAVAQYDNSKTYSLPEAASLVKKITSTKFDASVDLAVRLGVDPKKSNQMVRGTVSLPHGTGKDVRVLVLCTPDKEAEARALGRILGPRGLMPNPKTGTVTMDVGKAVTEKKAGNIDFKVDKAGIVHASIGRVSFDATQLAENASELISTLVKLKPSAAKGTYMKSIYVSSTMSPSVQVETKSVS